MSHTHLLILNPNVTNNKEMCLAVLDTFGGECTTGHKGRTMSCESVGRFVVLRLRCTTSCEALHAIVRISFLAEMFGWLSWWHGDQQRPLFSSIHTQLPAGGDLQRPQLHHEEEDGAPEGGAGADWPPPSGQCDHRTHTHARTRKQTQLVMRLGCSLLLSIRKKLRIKQINGFHRISSKNTNQ